MSASQLGLDLERKIERTRETFVVSDSNRDAVALLDAPETWNSGVLALVGPDGCGKTHLADDWATREQALVYDVARPPGIQLERAAGRSVLWKDADRADAGEEPLFHLINIAGRGGRLLLTGVRPPRDWPAALPDLRSRLNAITVAQLSEPDDAVMVGVLAKFFEERSIRPSDDVIPYMLRRIRRSVPAAWEAVRKVDQTAHSTGRAVTRALAREALGEDETALEADD